MRILPWWLCRWRTSYRLIFIARARGIPPLALYRRKNYEKEVKDVDLLIAPHHGRDTGGNDEYLDVLRPKLTLFGNAESEHLDYSSWNNRNLKKITNNEADCIIAEIINDEMNIYCTYGKFAKKYNINTYRNEKLKAWFLMKL